MGQHLIQPAQAMMEQPMMMGVAPQGLMPMPQPAQPSGMLM